MPPLAAIVSAGMSKIGIHKRLNTRELFLQAFLETLDRVPNLDRKKIGAIYVGAQSETYEHQIMYGTALADWSGLLPIGSMRVEGCAAAGSMAIRTGVMDIMSGLHDVVLVCGVEKMSNRTTQQVTDALMAAGDFPIEQWNGFTFPAIYAMVAVSYMHKYSAKEEDMALVAVKNHRNASENPKAHFQKEVTLDQVMSSRVIAWPYKLYDCSPVSDGAAVAILTRPEIARRFTDTPIYVEGSSNTTGTLGLYEREDPTWPEAIALACDEAYRMAGVEPSNIDLAEVHDAFTMIEIIITEAARLAERGKGYLLVREGETEIGGKVAVNPSGGLKARGHPVGATGMAQIYELYLQLTGQAQKRQVPNAEVGLAINYGGCSSAVLAHVLKR